MKFAAALTSALLSASVMASSHDSHHKRLHEHHKMSVNATDAALQKRFTGQATYFAVGLGACGKFNKASDFIVALNSPQYGGGSPGPQCFKTITISARGKTAQATIMDECPPCNYGSLDLSQGLFEHFADTSEGVFEMSWSFNGGGGGGGDDDDDKPKPHPKPTTKKHEEPEPTTSHKPKPTTAERQKPKTTSTKAKTTSKASSTSTKAASTTATPTPSAAAGVNLRQMNQFVVNAQNLLQFAAKN